MIGPFFQSFFGRKKSVIRYMTTTATKTTSAYLTSTTDSSSQHSLWLYVTSVTGHHHAAPPRLAREVSVRELSINSNAGGRSARQAFRAGYGRFPEPDHPSVGSDITRLRGVPDTTVTGVNGTVKNVYSADNISLQFGNIPSQSHSLISFDLTPVSNGVGTEISGILGLDLLQSLNIKIDYRDALVDFQSDPKRRNH